MFFMRRRLLMRCGVVVRLGCNPCRIVQPERSDGAPGSLSAATSAAMAMIIGIEELVMQQQTAIFG
jgi:hypothetical protein